MVEKDENSFKKVAYTTLLINHWVRIPWLLKNQITAKRLSTDHKL